MFDRRHVVAVALALVSASFAPAGAQAARGQSAAELRARIDSETVRARALRKAYEDAYGAEDRARDSLTVEGVRIGLGGLITARERARIETGVKEARATLDRLHGPAAAKLLDGLEATANRYGGNRYFRARIVMAVKGPGGTAELDVPLDATAVSRFLVRVAGDRLAQQRKELQVYSGAALLAELGDEYWFEVYRYLSLSWTSVGRRCAVGTMSACAVAVAPFDAAQALDRFYDRSDHQWLVATTELLPVADSAAHASKSRCRAGADTACHRVVHLVRINDPLNPSIRGAFANYAFVLGGRESVSRVATAPSGDALAVLSHVAGATPDSLLRGWHARLQDSRAGAKIGTPVLLLGTVGWCGILLVGTTRRRPS